MIKYKKGGLAKYNNGGKFSKLAIYDEGGLMPDPDYLRSIGMTLEEYKTKQTGQDQSLQTSIKDTGNYALAGNTATAIAGAINPIAGLGVGAINSFMQYNQNKDLKAKEDIYNKNKQSDISKQQKFASDKSYLTNYDVKGKQGVQFFNANGGNFDKKNDVTIAMYGRVLPSKINAYNKGGILDDSDNIPVDNSKNGINENITNFDNMDDNTIDDTNKKYFKSRVDEIGIDEATKEYNSFFEEEKPKKKKYSIKK